VRPRTGRVRLLAIRQKRGAVKPFAALVLIFSHSSLRGVARPCGLRVRLVVRDTEIEILGPKTCLVSLPVSLIRLIVRLIDRRNSGLETLRVRGCLSSKTTD